jgi:hypothetical protein
LAVLCYEIYVLFVLKNLIKPEDVRMIKVFENINLVIQSDTSVRGHLFFYQALDSSLFSSRFVYTLLNHPKAALSEDLIPLNLIVLEQFALSVLNNKVTLPNLHLIFVIDRVLFHHWLEFLS